VIGVALGWVAIVVFPQLLARTGLLASLLVLAGGLCYTLGAVIYARRRPNPFPAVFGYHELFHLFVVAAVLTKPHWGSVGHALVTGSPFPGGSLNTLLLLVDNFSENHKFDASQNGLWRVATSGSGLTRLTTEASGVTTSLCQFSQNPWSNVSRDGSMYAFQTMTPGYPATYTLAFGHLSGGTPQTLASITGTHLDLIGWTTM